MPGMQTFTFIPRMGRGRIMKRILAAAAAVLLLSGCGNDETLSFSYWEEKCNEDSFSASTDTCSQKQVYEYIKRKKGEKFFSYFLENMED